MKTVEVNKTQDVPPLIASIGMSISRSTKESNMPSVPKKPKAKVIAYHFLFDSGKLRNGKHAPDNGKWLSEKLPLEMCEHGLHASLRPFDALQYAPGALLCLVELGGKIEYGVDKVVAQKRKILARFDATDLLYDHARQSALSVIGNWKTPVPAVVIEYLNTGRADLRSAAESAAWSAAKSAARSEARSEAWSAAWSAADSAAWSAAESAAWSAAGSAAEFAVRSAARSAADSAAWSAAWSAAGSAAGFAVRSAAWSAVRSAASERLLDAVVAKFKAMGAL